MDKPDNEITYSELIEALIAISMVAKSLAKKVIILSMKKDKFGGEDGERKKCCRKDS